VCSSDLLSVVIVVVVVVVVVVVIIIGVSVVIVMDKRLWRTAATPRARRSTSVLLGAASILDRWFVTTGDVGYCAGSAEAPLQCRGRVAPVVPFVEVLGQGASPPME
jgi:hypothetical protein